MSIVGFLGVLATLAWMILVVVLIVIAVRASRNQSVRSGGVFIIALGALALVLTALSLSAVYIEPQERGVVLSAFAPGGYRTEVLQPGLRWVIPGAERVVRYSIANQTYTMSIVTNEGQVAGDDSISARTSDGQEIFLDASVIYKINPDRVIDVHIKWQERYTEDLVRAQSRGIIRDAVSQYGVQEVVTTQRFAMVDAMRKGLSEKLEANGLELVDFVLRNVAFSPEYAKSVEQKQISEQQAQQAKYVVEQRRQEADQARQQAQGVADAVVIRAKADAEARLIQAEAEAKSLEMVGKAIKEYPDTLAYQYISKISPNVQVMLLPSNSPFVFPLPQMQNLPSASEVLPTPAPAPTAVP